MFRLIKSAVIITILSAFLVQAQDKFEGKVVFEAYDSGQSQKINYLVKDKKFKIESPETGQMGNGSMIYDAEKNVMYIIMNEQKMYMEMPVDISEEMTNKETDKMEYFTKTGETKDISGYTCEKFIFKDENGEGAAWMTKELGSFMMFGDPEKMENASGWQKEIMGAGYFPMLVESMNSAGEFVPVFKVLELVPMNLDKDMFEIPAGFTKFDMQGMQNMHNNK